MTTSYRDALASLRQTDRSVPVPAVTEVLSAPENRHLLEYVVEDPFGAHVFPGNESGYSPSPFSTISTRS